MGDSLLFSWYKKRKNMDWTGYEMGFEWLDYWL